MSTLDVVASGGRVDPDAGASFDEFLAAAPPGRCCERRTSPTCARSWSTPTPPSRPTSGPRPATPTGSTTPGSRSTRGPTESTVLHQAPSQEDQGHERAIEPERVVVGDRHGRRGDPLDPAQ